MLRPRHHTVLLLFLTLAPAAFAQQGAPFGHVMDLRERLQRDWWRRDQTVMAVGGLSLIGAQWRGAGSLTLEAVTRQASARIGGTLRAGPLGDYGPDVDEWYDLVRLVEFVRLNAREDDPLFVRVGLLDALRLGPGHVVNFFSSSVAWDERTVGTELRWSGSVLDAVAFADNVFVDGVAGGRLALTPLGRSSGRALPFVTLGANYVADREHGLDSYSADIRIDLFESGGIFFSPFVSYARYRGYGNGLAVGADIYSDGFLDLLHFDFRVAAFYNGRQFIPGYFGSFYQVSNTDARIVQSSDAAKPAGTSLAESAGATDLLVEFRLAFYRDFSLWYYFRRHFGSQRLGEFHLRLFLHASDGLRVELGIDRGGLADFLTVFGPFGDLSALVFGTHYRLAGPLYIHATARYSFERLDVQNEARYLVQRRFEPMTGLRLRF